MRRKSKSRKCRVAGGSLVEKRGRVLVVCVHNGARSQIAEEYLRRFAGELLEVESAGLEPGSLNPHVVEALREEGIDISGKSTRSVFDLFRQGRSYEYVITVCDRKAEENCPVFPGQTIRLSWPFADPSAFRGSEAEIMERVREVRDRIRERVRHFVEEYRARTTDSEIRSAGVS